MGNKIIVASHGNLAEGLKNTVDMFLGQDSNKIMYLSLYSDGNNKISTDISNGLSRLMRQIKEEDYLLIFTDIYGGSVDQIFLKETMNMKNAFIICGFNLPIVLEAALSDKDMNRRNVMDLIEHGRKNLKLSEIEKENTDSTNDNEFF